MPIADQQQKAVAFRRLHESGSFLIPNPWDAGSAKVLEALGFPALATTSSGFAFTLGRLDGGVTLDELAGHVAAIDAATALPVSVDLENGYGPAPADVARAIETAARAGAVGGSIEDWDPAGRLYPIEEAVERLSAARQAAENLAFPFTLTARAENHIRGNPDLDDTIARLTAYAAVGADVLYAPGLRTPEEVAAVCGAVSRPVNVLALPGMDVNAVVAAGARRISVGGGLTWTAVQAMSDAASALRDSGDTSGLGSSRRIVEWLQS